VAADGLNRAVFVVTAAAIGFAYSILLPFAFTQRISWRNWHYLDARYLAYSVVFGLGVAWLITLQVHAVRVVIRQAASRHAGRGGRLGVFAVVVGVLPSLLCCSPLVPTLVGLLGLSATTRLRTTGRIQYFFATKENLILDAALVVLIGTGVWSLRKLVRAQCFADECSVSPGPQAT